VYKSLHDFWSNPVGANPIGGLVRAADGTMYGVNWHGGQYGFGTIFSIGVNGAFTNLYSFKGGLEPSTPLPSLSIGPDSCLYGVSNLGGGYNHGTLFKFNPVTGVLTVLYTFKDLSYQGRQTPQVAADGSVYGVSAIGDYRSLYRWTPSDGLKAILASEAVLTVGGDGYVYGCTPTMLFKFNSDGSMHKLRDLSTAEGTGYTYSLAPGPGGILWGITFSGGPNDRGVVYKIGTNGQGFYIVHVNADTDPITPQGPISIGWDNRLYGAGFDNGGGDGHYLSMGVDGKAKILLDFVSGTSYSPITVGRDGRPYFVATVASSARYGGVFKIMPAGDVKEVKNFQALDLAASLAAPIQFANGDRFGRAVRGGAFAFGGIYRLAPDGKYTILYNFLHQSRQNDASLTLGADGNAYVLDGGQFCKVTPDGIATATDIVPADAQQALSGRSLTLGKDGLLYAVGGQSVYTVSYAGTATKLAVLPEAGYTDKLVLAGDGSLYALLQFDGNGDLSLYSVAPSGVVNTIKYTGGDPYAYPQQLNAGPDGALYGLALGTGPNQASFIYKVDVKAAKLTKIYTFSLTDVWRPASSSIAARADGTIFGAAGRISADQLNVKGVVFAISPTGQFSVVANIPKHGGPSFGLAGGLKLDGDHALIGVSGGGGLHGNGALFRITGL